MKSNAFLNLVVVIVLVVIGYWAVTGTDLFKNLSFNEQSLVGAPAAVSTAVLGTNSIGSILDEGSVNAINASPYTMPAEGGKAVSISVYIENIEAGSQFGLAIYDDVSGKPGKLVASTPAQTLDGSVTAGWKTVPITADLKANTKYWLAYNANAVGTKKNLLRYVPATPGSNVWKFIGLGVWPSDYSTAPGSTGEGSNLISIYVTYEKPVTTTTTTTSYTPVAPNTNFAVGSRITVSQGPVNVRSSTSRSSNNIIGTQPTGALGNIIQGPINQAGFTWWKVDYDTGVDGWTTGAYHYVIGVLNTTSSSGGSTSSSSGSTSSSSSGTPAPIPFSFRLFDGSNKTIVQGASATSSVTVQKVAGTAEAVNFSVSGLPTGVGGTFSPTSCTPNTSCSSTLTLTAQASASIGTRTVTITGSSNSTSTNTSFVLTIDAAPVVVVPTTTPTTGLYKTGDRVRVTQGPLNIRSNTEITPSSKLGEQPTNAVGTVTDGPRTGVGNTLIWWNVNYDNGVDGWNTQNYITLATGYVPPVTGTTTSTSTPATTTPAKSTTFQSGDKVEVEPGTVTLNVRSGPGTGYAILGTKTDGNTGIVQTDINNGLLANENNWWKVDFGGLVGWAAETFLRLFQNQTPIPVTSVPADGVVPLGINLEGNTDWSRSYMFVDAIKSSRYRHDGSFETPTYTAEGWPIGDFKILVFANANCYKSDAQWNCIDKANSHDPILSGTYSLSFTGNANVTASGGSIQNKQYSNGVTTAQVVVPTSTTDLWLYFSGTNGQPTTNIKLIRPGYAANTTQTFTNEFLAAIQPFKIIRLMDYLETNWAEGDARTPIANWSNRTLPTLPSQHGNAGGSIEYMVELANTADKDLWINIPHTATQNYIDGLANYLRTALEPGRNVYLEFSNEIWNGQFLQTQQLLSEVDQTTTQTAAPTIRNQDGWIKSSDLSRVESTDWCKPPTDGRYTVNQVGDLACISGIAEIRSEASSAGRAIAFTGTGLGRVIAGPVTYNGATWFNVDIFDNRYYMGRRLTIKKIINVSDTFRRVFGDAAMPGTSANPRIRPVFADQVAAWAIVSDSLSWAQYSYPRPINYYLYGIAAAPYFGSDNAWANPNVTVDQIITGPGSVEEGYNSRMGGETEGDRSKYTQYYSMAQAYGLKMLGYEGGTDLGQLSNSALQANLGTRILSSYDPRMENNITGYLSQWFACGGDAFMYFNLSAVNSKWGQWGLTDDVRKDYPVTVAPKLRGAQKVANSDGRNLECAYTGNGFYGLTLAGSPVLGTGSGLLGTYYSDSNFSQVAVTRIDPVLNFIWVNYGTGVPFPRPLYTGTVMPGFSVKWSGQIQPKFTGNYTFTLEKTSGDTVSLFTINGQNMLTDTSIDLVAGTKYSIKIDFKPKVGGSKARLWWELPGKQVKAIVPKAQLYSN